MSVGLGDVVAGEPTAVLLAMAAAVLFGALHALMPGHGKMVLVFYHLGQPTSVWQAAANGVIVALTHVGLAIVLVFAGFAVISRAFASGGRTPEFELASGVLVTLIGSLLLWRTTAIDHRRCPREGRALAFVTGLIPCPLTTFIMSFALARGVAAAGLAVTAAMAIGMIATIGGFALAATFLRGRLLGWLTRSERWRHRLGFVLEVGGSVIVLLFGLGLVFKHLSSPKATYSVTPARAKTNTIAK
jgi:ABC-type nickel/cobalt efflux system permease component RcnA